MRERDTGCKTIMKFDNGFFVVLILLELMNNEIFVMLILLSSILLEFLYISDYCPCDWRQLQTVFFLIKGMQSALVISTIASFAKL